MKKTLTTYSFWNAYRGCHKLCEWRYIDELVPTQRNEAMAFGTIIHKCLEMWHGGIWMNDVLAFIDKECTDKSDWHYARAMMLGYRARYSAESSPFSVVALEKTFEGQIRNPKTGKPSAGLFLAGKVDGIVKQDGEYYLLEHKTAATVDGDYLEKLWCDFQTTLYAHYIEQAMNIKLAGVIYNVLVKSQLKQGKGETEEEYLARREELLAKSMTGKTTAKQKIAETDDDFQARLLHQYSEPKMFHREMLYISRDNYDAMKSDLWELTQEFLASKRRKTFSRNTGNCFAYHRACPYLPLCRANGSEIVRDNYYEKCPPHQELLAEPEQEETF